MNLIITATSFLWALIAIALLQQWIKPLKNVSVGLAIFIFLLVFVTAPALMIANVVMSFIDMVFPEGWEDDDQKTKF